MRGALWRVANEQMRPATNEESQGAELVNRYLAEMRIDLMTSRGQRRYVNVEKEGPPRFPGDPQIEGEDAEDDDDSDYAPTAEPEADAEVEPPAAPEPFAAPESEQRSTRTDPEPESEGSNAGSVRATSSQGQMPYPFNRVAPYVNFYQDATLQEASYGLPFTAAEAAAFWNEEHNAFFIRKKPEDAEIDIDRKSTRLNSSH